MMPVSAMEEGGLLSDCHGPNTNIEHLTKRFEFMKERVEFGQGGGLETEGHGGLVRPGQGHAVRPHAQVIGGHVEGQDLEEPTPPLNQVEGRVDVLGVKEVALEERCAGRLRPPFRTLAPRNRFGLRSGLLLSKFDDVLEARSDFPSRAYHRALYFLGQFCKVLEPKLARYVAYQVLGGLEEAGEDGQELVSKVVGGVARQRGWQSVNCEHRHATKGGTHAAGGFLAGLGVELVERVREVSGAVRELEAAPEVTRHVSDRSEAGPSTRRTLLGKCDELVSCQETRKSGVPVHAVDEAGDVWRDFLVEARQVLPRVSVVSPLVEVSFLSTMASPVLELGSPLHEVARIKVHGKHLPLPLRRRAGLARAVAAPFAHGAFGVAFDVAAGRSGLGGGGLRGERREFFDLKELEGQEVGNSPRTRGHVPPAREGQHHGAEPGREPPRADLLARPRHAKQGLLQAGLHHARRHGKEGRVEAVCQKPLP
mmetsp:Transcript_34097/g.76997  ORF Transcript_34097/g.76997 Transcript_34097/m.76997 type:complete len:482 (+) Transcript_34097:334-1779(+)